MSIDFDSAALQTQHDEEEYDQEDYAREQELHKLLTDLPDDMLEDSRDCSSPELEGSPCSNKNTGSSPQSKWTQEWSDHTQPTSHTQTYEVDYGQGSHDEYQYEDEATHINGRPNHQLLPHSWTQDQFAQERCPCPSIGSDKCPEVSDSCADFDAQSYPESFESHVKCNGEGGHRSERPHEDHNTRSHFQNLNFGLGDHGANQHKVNFNPQHRVLQPQMFNAPAAQIDDQFDQLQRVFLDSTQETADKERVAQLQILNKAQKRQIEDLERKLEDSRRNLRYINHQFAIVKDEKDGLTVSFKESSRLIEEVKEREAQMQNKLKAAEQQVQLLRERDQENMKKQRVADAAVDSMKQQMLELCRSDTLSRAREQHDRDLAVTKEQHNAALLALQQKLDSTSQALNEQTDVGQKLRDQVKLLENQREAEQLERANVINSLSQRLEESQRQCAKLLQTNSVQEMSQMQIRLQQAQSAKALSENTNQVLQEDLADLKEQITLYEAAVKHGVISLELSNEPEHHLSESCMDLGLKTANRKNGTFHSTALAHLLDSKLPKDEALRLLQAELQRCLGCLKGKRQKISRLQEDLQRCQARVSELQAQLDEAKLNASVKEASQVRHLDMTGDSRKELLSLQEDKQNLLEQVELLEKKTKELQQSEEKLKSTNTELCTKMREMIQELDQEKQEAAERAERIHQQFRDDVVNRARAELLQEHSVRVEQLTAQHQQEMQQLETQLAEVNDKMLAVQECYISVCKEKSSLEETIQRREKGEALLKEESDAAAEELRRELRAAWSKETESEIQRQVDSHVASAEAKWKNELQKREKTWVQKLEEATRERNRETAEVTCQTDESELSTLTVSAEELESRLRAQKQQLQLDADEVQRKAVEEARKRLQRELEEKHLEDMAKQVEGAVTRAYNSWIENLSSLPEFQASLKTEKEKWEKLQEEITNQKVSQALREAEEQRSRNQQEDQSSGAGRVEELQQELAALKLHLEQASREQAALLRAELAAARAAWSRDKRQEVSVIEQTYQSRLQQAVQRAREDAELQRKELLLQTEAKLQQAARAREEEWGRQRAEAELTQRRQIRDEFIAELQAGLTEVRAQLLGQETENQRRPSGSISHILQTCCGDLVDRAVSEARREWDKTSEEKWSRVLKEAQEQHLSELNKMQSCSCQRRDEPRCRRECTETLSKLQKKNQELQRHLEKACRQLQHSVREHKAAVQRLKDEHESSIQKVKAEHLQQLLEVEKAKESSGSEQQNLQQGLEEMKQQYLMTVEKIRGDMLRYLQESRERAAEMIRTEVQRERQDTARKMRRYYLTCLQELLEDGSRATGRGALIVLNLLPPFSIAPRANRIHLSVFCRAEKKIMNAASKLAAMAKVLETPVKSQPRKNYGLPSLTAECTTSGGAPGRPAGLCKTLSTLNEIPDTRPEERSNREKTSADPGQKSTIRTKPPGPQDTRASQQDSVEKPKRPEPSHANPASSQKTPRSHVEFVSLSVRGNGLEWRLQEGNPNKADACLESGLQGRPLLTQETPVREEKRTDWSVASCDSDAAFRLSYCGRKVEPVRPFSMSAGSANETGEFSGLTPDVSNRTVYNQVPEKTSGNNPHTKKSLVREPIPGSECEGELGLGPRPQFSELRQRQQDSGFDSPFYQQH
ncbi:centrosomal protein of 152 kDa isoform X2 [Austrofundulus limnaeus]|uniref:Centrosomal protein of 152 kDa isoform X2 n=1 Tax=Austrofundulus limnaeus TaxID=52670 RepID=A0A2I4CAG1_AUSLI|nr:PREDICTED: centrosomal protein of 152 kDa isoform X2 [Austrofundulus limnaeus]